MRASEVKTLIPHWRRDLTSRNRSAATIKTYVQDAHYLCDHLIENGDPEIDRRVLVGYFADLIERPSRTDGRSPISASYVAKQNRHVRQLFRWLYEEGEIEDNWMTKVKPPKVRQTPPEIVAEEELRALLGACSGREFEDIRDTAIIRLLLDTGMRVSELVGITVDRYEPDNQIVLVLGKGNKQRPVPYGEKTATALRRYSRRRDRHNRAGLPNFWLSPKGGMTDSGVRQVLTKRSKAAGLSHMNPHRFRHTFAHQWLASGGQETDLMNLAGWSSRQMLTRYGASAAQERAVAAHRRAALGDRV